MKTIRQNRQSAWPTLSSLWLAACLCVSIAQAADRQPVAADATPIRIAMIEGLSGPFANAGDAVVRNVQWAIEQVNQQGGVRLPDGRHPLQLVTFDNKQGIEESLVEFKRATDQGIHFVIQGNSSAVASALIDAVNKYNSRVANSDQRVLFLNYSAVDPTLTNEKCSVWHFRFDADATMRMNALTEVMRADTRAKRVYLIGQDYSFGHQVAQAARTMIAAKRPDMSIVGEDFHPVGKVKDFSPYIAKIKAANADAVVTGNWGNDLTLLVKAAREAGLHLKFYTFYGNGLGAPAAIGDAGVGRVLAVAEWHPNAGDQAGGASDQFYQAFRRRYPDPAQDYVHLRMHVMIRMLAESMARAGTTDVARVARALEQAHFDNGFYHADMRASDHQLLQPLYVSSMQRLIDGGIRFDVEHSGYGFKTERYLAPADTALPTLCHMTRPW